MNKEFQNSAGFLKTKRISDDSLIAGISNFEFSPIDVHSFSDVELEIPERLMLGKRAERYFSEWLKQSDEYHLLAENVQVIRDKQTLGEFDFFIQRESDQHVIHVELVYKFYLFDPSVKGSEFEHWIGPNRRDQLDYKLDKLENHQFPLLCSESAKETLSTLKINPETTEQQVLFLANLFVPMDEKVSFDRVNVNAVEGNWMKLSDWERFASANDQFAMPEKKDWFSREFIGAEWCSKDEMHTIIQSKHNEKRSPLIYSVDKNGTQRRDFVVWW